MAELRVGFTPQNILLSAAEEGEGKEKIPSQMYLRGAAAEKILSMPPGARVDFDTYFNSFSLKKWLELTSLSGLTLALKLKGRVTVELTGLDWRDGHVEKTPLGSQTISAPEPSEFLLPYPPTAHTLTAFSLFSHEETTLYGGRYLADVSGAARQIKIALVICAYKKEEYVKRNIAMLSGVEGISVFVVDNGETLSPALVPGDNLYIYPNRNAGGSGGFARGIMEVFSSGHGYTHILLMDDDVSVSVESIERLKNLLSVLKEDAADAVIGGAMLRRDKPSIQEENGAWIVPDVKEGVRQISNGRFADLCSLDAVVKNETAEAEHAGKRYQPWYFCCFPASVAERDILPLPLFIRGDDVEYSLRNFKKFINMNGLCVWHDSFENKPDNMLHYYVNRNLYIIMLLSMTLPRKYVIRRMIINLRNQLYRYNYNAADAILDAFADFLAGPRYLAQTPPESILERQLAKNEPMTPCGDLTPVGAATCRPCPTFLFKLIFRLTIGGHWIPSPFLATEGALSISDPYDPRRCFLKKRLRFIDYDGQRELRREINRVRCLQIAARYFFLRVYSIFRHGALRREWNEAAPGLTQRLFWKQYLNI